MVAPAEAYLRAATLSPSESRFWGPIDAMWKLLRVPPAACCSCDDFVVVAERTNQLYLAGHLQGFTEDCARLLGLQLEIYAAIGCPCAEVSSVQAAINLARLERHRGDLPALTGALDLVEAAVDRLRSLDPADLPDEPAEALLDGRIAQDALSARVVEIAKFNLAAGNFQSALAQVAPLCPRSSTAMEIQIRCELELRRFDRVLACCADMVPQRDWLRDYAAIALFRGGMVDAGRELADRLVAHHPLPRLRLISELLHHGCTESAVALGGRLAAAAARNFEEPTILIAAALFHDAGVAVESLTTQAATVAATSRHFPSVALAAAAIGMEPPSLRMRQARDDLDRMAALYRAALQGHRKYGCSRRKASAAAN